MLHFTLRQLKVFESVAAHLNFSRAAEELHLTQPAVSMQVKQLEQNIGLPLFEQIGKRIYLTEAGREMFNYSRAISKQLEEIEGVMDQLKGLERGKLNIAVVGTANYFAPQLLAKFCQRHPNITVKLNVANREHVLQQLQNNETDLAIIGQPPQDMDITAQPFLDNPLVMIAAANHPLANEHRIPLARLADETFILREQGSGTRAAMERIFAEQKLKPKGGMEMSTNEAVKQAVQAGMGLGIISLHTVELELETRRLKVLDVENFPLIRHWFIAHREHKRLSSVASAFIEFLKHEAAGIVPTPHHASKK